MAYCSTHEEGCHEQKCLKTYFLVFARDCRTMTSGWVARGTLFHRIAFSCTINDACYDRGAPVFFLNTTPVAFSCTINDARYDRGAPVFFLNTTLSHFHVLSTTRATTIEAHQYFFLILPLNFGSLKTLPGLILEKYLTATYRMKNTMA